VHPENEGEPIFGVVGDHGAKLTMYGRNQ
jgi:hypothetical protein